MVIDLPEKVLTIITLLEQNGHKAYIVGGCVRDSLLGRTPNDWDISTSAHPDQIKRSLSGCGIRILNTGIQYGSITAEIDKDRFEITTFRSDGTYSDGRHPEQVRFVKTIQEDLSRRDLTINAMAYNPSKGLIDPYSGKEDCKNRIIRCVGDPDTSFQNDALRMMRAIRFAAQLGFKIDPQTWQSAKENLHLLEKLSADRIREEFLKIIGSKTPSSLLKQYPEIFDFIIPEFIAMHGCKQENPYHVYDVWGHTLKVLENVECRTTDPILRLAALFHDISKPQCKLKGKDEYDHFHGHAKEGAKVTQLILKRLRFDKNVASQIIQLVAWHDKVFTCQNAQVKRWLNKIGEDQLRRLLILRSADILGQNLKHASSRLAKVNVMKALMEDIIRENQCFRMRDLAISGEDLKRLGIPEGKEIGRILNLLFEKVIDEELENNRDTLIDQAIQICEAQEKRVC